MANQDSSTSFLPIKDTVRQSSTKDTNNQPENKSNNSTNPSHYLGFLSFQKIVCQLLTCNRVVLLPTVIPKITESELTKKLNITLKQFRCLQKSFAFYKKMAKPINDPLVNLYCESKLQQSAFRRFQ